MIEQGECPDDPPSEENSYTVKNYFALVFPGKWNV